MTKKRPSSETVATAALTVISLVGGLAVACTAGVGTRTVSDAARPPAPVVSAPAPAPSTAAPSPEPTPTGDPALDSPRLRFPADAVVDVRAAYQAKGDGSTDDTAALQNAITENPGRTLYLAAGTYVVTRPIEAKDRIGEPQAGLRLVGEERNSTVIKLKDRSSGFGDPWNPRPILRTGGGGGTPSGRATGHGNLIENLTVDAGTNGGAVGIDYTGSNVAALRRLTITGKGSAGIALTRAWPGPALISRIAVRGFNYGIRVAQGQYGLTLEHIAISGQRIAGVDNSGNILAIHGLTSDNTVPAIRADRTGFVSLVDAKLTGGTPDFSAIQTTGEILVRRVSTAGYRSALTAGGRIIAGNDAAQYASKNPYAVFPETPSKAADLPVRDTPAYVAGDPSGWASAVAFGAKPDDDGDDTAAIQKALDAGKPVVYLPAGRYVVSRTLRVRATLRQLAGMGATITPTGAAFGDANAPVALVEVADGAGPDVTVSDLTVRTAGPAPGLIGFVHRAARAVVLKDVACCGQYKWSYHAEPGAGPLYLENVSAARWQFDQPQQVWARQLNDDDTDAKDRTLRVLNAGATVWLLGFETERGGPLVRTERGGRTEILGGAVYETGSANDVAFECVDDASMAVSFATMGPGDGLYRTLVRQRRGGAGKDLTRQQAAWRGEGRAVPLFTG